jgi:hypothetical protein
MVFLIQFSDFGLCSDITRKYFYRFYTYAEDFESFQADNLNPKATNLVELLLIKNIFGDVASFRVNPSCRLQKTLLN